MKSERVWINDQEALRSFVCTEKCLSWTSVAWITFKTCRKFLLKRGTIKSLLIVEKKESCLCFWRELKCLTGKYFKYFKYFLFENSCLVCRVWVTHFSFLHFIPGFSIIKSSATWTQVSSKVMFPNWSCRTTSGLLLHKTWIKFYMVSVLNAFAFLRGLMHLINKSTISVDK